MVFAYRLYRQYMSLSVLVSSEYKSCIVSSESEGIGYCNIYLVLLRLVGDIVEVKLGIGCIIVYGWRHYARFYCFDAGDGLKSSACAESMTDGSLDR